MTSYLSKLSPVPAFPAYTGPYKVGTIDVEIPISELDCPSPRPDDTSNIHTVLFRIFYPAHPSSNGRNITWLPAPQRSYVSAHTKFLGVGPLLAEFVSFFPRHLHYTSIPVHKNAAILEPNTESGRWPTAIFSHGLGGSRNAYSHLVGALASHGVIVVCPEHRDGSAITTFVRIPDEQVRYFERSRRLEIPYNRIPHDTNPEVFAARQSQLRIRCWELGHIHSALLDIDQGSELLNLNKSTPQSSLLGLVGKMDIHRPGSIIFAGHSFGAATVTQFLKSTYYANVPEVKAMEKPLFTPAADSELRRQITEKNVTILLDMWCFPLTAPDSAALFKLPLPVYDDVPTAPGGNALLAVSSEAFYKWTEHIHLTARVLSPQPSAEVVTSDLFERPSGVRLPEPNLFYVEQSAHLSQSDFGILFPWVTKRIFNSVEPERALRLNLRAQLQVLRLNNIPIARTSTGDLVEGTHLGKVDLVPNTQGGASEEGILDDKAILDRSANKKVDYWVWIDTFGLGKATEQDSPEAEDRAEETQVRIENENMELEVGA